MAVNEKALVNPQGGGAVLEQVIIQGDLSKLKPEERVAYYRSVCESVGLNPLTKPFDYINLNGKLTLYAKRDATDQLRKIHGISVVKLEREKMDDVYVVTAYGKDRTGREDSAIGAVGIGGLKGDNLANAMMKAETKSKRRLALSLAGLGWLDETEVDSIPGAKTVSADVIDVQESQKAPVDPTATETLASMQQTVQDFSQHMVDNGALRPQDNAADPANAPAPAANELLKQYSPKAVMQKVSALFPGKILPNLTDDERRQLAAVLKEAAA